MHVSRAALGLDTHVLCFLFLQLTYHLPLTAVQVNMENARYVIEMQATQAFAPPLYASILYRITYIPSLSLTFYVTMVWHTSICSRYGEFHAFSWS